MNIWTMNSENLAYSLVLSLVTQTLAPAFPDDTDDIRIFSEYPNQYSHRHTS